MTGITIDANEVLSIATRIDSDNNSLLDLLMNSKAAIDSLSAYWQGRAADETRAAYESFANKFFDQYKEVLDQYVVFLRRNVAEQYTETENVNTQLADAFK